MSAQESSSFISKHAVYRGFLISPDGSVTSALYFVGYFSSFSNGVVNSQLRFSFNGHVIRLGMLIYAVYGRNDACIKDFKLLSICKQ